MRHIIPILCVGACSAFVPSYVGARPGYQPPVLYHFRSASRSIMYNNDDEECIITDDMYNDNYVHNVAEFNETSTVVPKIKFSFTLMDCLLALLFGGKWSAAYFWKAVEQRMIKDTLALVIVIGIIYELVTNIDIHV